MLCRPVTAAGFGLPFGIAFLHWLVFAREDGKSVAALRRMRMLTAIGLPLVAGWATMLAYNQQVTGSWRTSPYRLYTDLYTPRHVYGFNNGVRGEQKQGPKVISSYDRWATNLTPELAAINGVNRWLISWLWTFDLLPLLLSSIVVLGTANRLDRRWLAIGFAILSMNAIHIPYWYVGIMGWHYVFETSLIWCLFLGLATDLLFRDWNIRGCRMMPGWWSLLLIISFAGDYIPIRLLARVTTEMPRIFHGIGSIRAPRRQYAEFDKWLQSQVTEQPAVVLIEGDANDQHMDYVVTSPDLSDRILRARFQRGISDVKSVADAFPDRSLYLCQPDRRTIELLKPLAMAK